MDLEKYFLAITGISGDMLLDVNGYLLMLMGMLKIFQTFDINEDICGKRLIVIFNLQSSRLFTSV